MVIYCRMDINKSKAKPFKAKGGAAWSGEKRVRA